MTTYQTGEIKVEPRKTGGQQYFVAVLYNIPAHFSGVGRTPLDAIHNLLDKEDAAKWRAEGYPIYWSRGQ